MNTVAAYRDKVAAGGCCTLLCQEPGRHEFAVWWKCPEGHRTELKYCKAHGPKHFAIAVQGARIECRNEHCYERMSPVIEGT